MRACFVYNFAMPVYDYTCKSCGQRFDKLVKSAENRDKAACPKCGSKQTSRALSVFAVGAEGSAKSAAEDTPMCGRCGGPGPCALE
jgi:putative FmdB family regulatory protein